jgi:protein TonB
MTYVSSPNTNKKMAILGSVAALHAGAFYVLVTGLAGVVILIEPPRLFTAHNDPIAAPIATPTAQPTTRPHIDTRRPTVHDPVPAPRPIDPTPTGPVPRTIDPMPTGPTPGEGELLPTPSPIPGEMPQGVTPRGHPRDWITTDDYPAQDLREENAGTTGFRLTIGMDGRVQSCTITASSGHPGLDAATCKLVIRRAVFKPATDSAGAKTAGSYQSLVRWIIPQR